MSTVVELFVIMTAAAYVVSMVDYFIDLKIWRALIALVTAYLCFWCLEQGWLFPVAMSAAFIGLTSIRVFDSMDRAMLMRSKK